MSGVTEATYRTDDGEEFLDRALAEQHQELLDAFNEHKAARTKYAHTLAHSTFKTADGQAPEFGRWLRDYFFVREVGEARPFLEKVSLYDWDAEIVDGRMVYFYTEKRGHEWRRIKIEFNELYADRSKAESHLADLQRRWIGWQLDDLSRIVTVSQRAAFEALGGVGST